MTRWLRHAIPWVGFIAAGGFPTVLWAQPSYITQWGAFGGSPGQFASPVGVATDPSGNVYVADSDNHRIQKFTGAGVYLAQWGAHGSGNGQFDTPFGVTVDAAGSVYVADRGNNRIQKFTSNGDYLGQWGSHGTGSGQFDDPLGVASDAASNVYVVERASNRVQKFTSTGGYLTQWGSFGTLAGQFRFPQSLAVDAVGNVYVADWLNHRVQKFTGTGAYVTQWGAFGSLDGQFKYPVGIAIAANGDVFVSDTENARVQQFNTAGAHLVSFGTTGSDQGQFNLPRGVTTDAAGSVYIADTNNHRIQKFGDIDIDGDAIPDVWETLGIPIAGGGTYPIPGASPLHKDLYVEVDAVVGHAPSFIDLQRVVDAFAASPVTNPDATTGIRLHVVGPGCDPCVSDANIPAQAWPNPPWPEVHAIKDSFYGTAVERAQGNWLAIREARAEAIRYCVFGIQFTPEGASGLAEGVGLDFVVTLGGWESNVSGDMRVGTFMHELGHSLGLSHGGYDDVNYKPNYFSVMNYMWQMPITVGVAREDLERYRSSWRLNYMTEPTPSDHTNPPLSPLIEAGLSELNGIGGDPSRFVPIGPPRGLFRKRLELVRMGGPVDWDGSGTLSSALVPRDINFTGYAPNLNPSPDENLTPRDDWRTLSYAVSEDPPAAPLLINVLETAEMSPAIYDSLSRLEFDCNDNGVADHEEIAASQIEDANGNGIPDPCEALAMLTAVSGPPALPLKLAILPDPGGAVHAIHFTLPEDARTTLRVFDVSGRVVATLMNGDATRGEHRIVWDGLDDGGGRVRSGVYLIRLQSGGYQASGRALVLR